MDAIQPTSIVNQERDRNIQALRNTAAELESVFIAQMLKSAGLGKTSSQFGGGIGEEQFSSFLVDQHAKAISKSGGFGLSEHIFNALKQR